MHGYVSHHAGVQSIAGLTADDDAVPLALMKLACQKQSDAGKRAGKRAGNARQGRYFYVLDFCTDTCATKA